ncbi:MAG: radical SAM protein [Acetobacteraceae bacterium]|nr:radical SAM protein [Acetobacteraceae bacterium]
MRMPAGPAMAYIRIVEACNARCRMCRFAGSGDKFRPSLEALVRLFAQMQAMGVRHIRFTGAEPLLYEDLVPALAFVAGLDVEAGVITNGALLGKHLEGLVRARTATVICSLDSPDADTHDLIRATPGLFDTAVRAIREMHRWRVRDRLPLRIGVNTVLNNLNYRQMVRMARSLAEWGVDSWALNPVKDAPSLFLSRAQILEFNRTVPEIEKALRDGGVSLKALTPYVLGRDDREVALSAGGRYPARPGRCYVPYLVAYVDAKQGTVTACNLLPHRKDRPLTQEGLWDKGFAAIWNSPAYRAKREAFARRAARACTGCEPANAALNARVDNAAHAGTVMQTGPDLIL